MRRAAKRLLASVAVLGLLSALLPPAAGGAPLPLTGGTAAVADPDPGARMRGDLVALVEGRATLDPRIASLVAGYRAGEIPYFAVLDAPNDDARRAQLEGLGARVLRAYRSVDAFALASDAATVRAVAALPWVAWMAPVELVFALDEPVTDQTRSHTADVGAPPQWAAGVTGDGVRIAVLDTGVDPAHPDLDDLDFGSWSSPLSPAKVVDARDFNGGVCRPLQVDGHGHGTHVAGIATGTGEGLPTADDDARHAGIAPGAELAVGKVLTDAGAGINSDLVAAMEWAAMPEDLLGCAIGADIVNLSLGSEARPQRLNSDSDVDFVGYVLNRLAVEYGTLFVVAAGNSGPYIGSVLEAPGAAAQALSVAATAKDWDVNHDDTASGDSCAGWRHPGGPGTNDCSAGVGDQPPSVSAFSSRGPSGDVWLRPDLAAPGYNIVSAQSTTGAAIASNDLSRNTRGDALYATATGTPMASPATAGSAALLLEAYRDRHGTDPTGASGRAGMTAPTYALLRAALMNSAGGGLFESRWILTTDAGTSFECPDPDPLFGLCAIVEIFADFASGSLTLYEARNQGADPYVGPLAEGAGKLDVGRAMAALRDGVVIYSTAGGGAAPGTGHRDFQGSWQVGPVTAGAAVSQQFVVHAAPGVGPLGVSFAFEPGAPSDGSRAIDGTAWQVALPAPATVPAGGDRLVSFSLRVPAGAAPGAHTGTIVARTSAGQTLRLPVFASVALHDPDPAPDNVPGPQAAVTSARDVYAKGDTTWPSVAGAAGGTAADWLVYPVELRGQLDEVRFAVHDADRGDEVYDLYLYDAQLDLLASTHPFAAPGVTDADASAARPPSTAAAPQRLVVAGPAAGRHYLVVSRSVVGGTNTGDFGAFVLVMDEVRDPGPAAPNLVVSDIELVNLGRGGGDDDDDDDDDDDRKKKKSGDPKAGDRVRIRATITNSGSQAAAASQTGFSLDGSPLPGSTVATGPIPGGGSRVVELTWDTRHQAGDHTLTVTADLADAVIESNEADNSTSRAVSVRGNKVKNGDFEDDDDDDDEPDDWDDDDTDAGDAKWGKGGSHGDHSASVVGNGGNALLAGAPSWTSAPIAATAGEVLTLTASVRVAGASSAPSVGVVYLGAAGEVLSQVTVLTAPLTTTGFVDLEEVVRVPAGVHELRIVLSGFAPTDLATAGTVTFDDVGLFGE